MLSSDYIKNVGVFNSDLILPFLSKLKNTDNISEVDNMLLTAILSTHLLYFQFIEKQNMDLSNKKLVNLRIIEDF